MTTLYGFVQNKLSYSDLLKVIGLGIVVALALYGLASVIVDFSGVRTCL